jgi:hypothetical protein
MKVVINFRPKLRYQFSVGMVRMKDTPSVLVFLLLAKLTAIPGVGSRKNSESQKTVSQCLAERRLASASGPKVSTIMRASVAC